MVGREKVLSVLEAGLSSSRAPQTEIVAVSRILRVVRFANSTIHQPVEERDITLFVRVLREGRIGFASVNGLGQDSLQDAIRNADRNASIPLAVPMLLEFPKPAPIRHLNGYYESTASTGSEALEEKVKLLVDRGRDKGILFAGVLWTSLGEMAVVNSNGIKLYHPWTAANCQTVATRGDLSGFSAQASPEIGQIRPEEVGEAAVHRALRFQQSVELPPGEYACLLEEYAVAELLLYLSHMSFTADSVEEGRSVLKKGKKIADRSVSIWDDATNPLTFQMPFDVEGTSKRKVVFVEEGVGRDVVHDRVTAGRFKTESTGHALPLDYSEGPLPLHLEMAAGESSKEEMLRSMKRGLLVTRFHYIREVHPLKTMVTGMTRDGVYLVENGEVVSRVKNLRFTESILGAFSRVEAISRERKLVAGEIDGGFPTGVIAPKVLVKKFSFTGTTQF